MKVWLLLVLALALANPLVSANTVEVEVDGAPPNPFVPQAPSSGSVPAPSGELHVAPAAKPAEFKFVKQQQHKQEEPRTLPRKAPSPVQASHAAAAEALEDVADRASSVQFKLPILNKPLLKRFKKEVTQVKKAQETLGHPEKLLDRARSVIATRLDRTVSKGLRLYKRALSGEATEQDLKWDEDKPQKPCKKESKKEQKPKPAALPPAPAAKPDPRLQHSYPAHAMNPLHQIDNVEQLITGQTKDKTVLAETQATSQNFNDEDHLPTFEELRAAQAAEAARPKWCPGCQHIVYNADSPLSHEDHKDLRRVHRKVHIDADVRVHGEEQLQKARVTVWKAAKLREKLLQKYPPPEDVLLQVDRHN